MRVSNVRRVPAPHEPVLDEERLPRERPRHHPRRDAPRERPALRDPERDPGQDQRHQTVEAHGVVGGGDVGAALAQPGDETVVQPRVHLARDHRERAAGQRRGIDVVRRGQRVVGGEHDHRRFAPDECGVQLRGQLGLPHPPGVESPVDDGRQLLGTAQGNRDDAHRRVGRSGPREQVGPEVLGVPDANLGRSGRARPPRGLPGAVRRRDGRARLRQERLAHRRQRHPTAGAGEQRGAELALQAPDLLADRLLAHVHPGGGAAEVAFLGHRDHVLQLAQLHPALLIDRLSLSHRGGDGR
ncbi:MAG TPA: hypothetical protein VGI02_11515 [Actinomycetospora sp.]